MKHRASPARAAGPADEAPLLTPGAAWLGTFAALATGALAALWIHLRIGLVRGPFVWDEGAQALRALITEQGLRAHDLAQTWSGLVLDPNYPPLNALGLAADFLLLGPSEPAAFLRGAVAFAIAAAVLWRIGAALGGWIAGTVALALLLGSHLHIEYAATAMLELPGTALTLIALGLAVANERRPRAWRAWLGGAALAALFLEKYNYGLLLLAAVVANELFRRPFRPLARERIGLWLLPVVVGAAWLAVPGEMAGFLDFAANRDSGLGLWRGLLFYPRAIAEYDAAWWPAGALAIVGAVAAAARWRRPGVRLVLLFAAIGLLAMTVHRYKLERSIATIVPALWLLAGVACAHAIRRASAWSPAPRIGLTVAIAAVLLAPLPALYARDIPAIGRLATTHERHRWARFPWPGRELQPVEDLIARSVDPALPIYVAGEFNELAPPVVWWSIARRHPRAIVIDRCWVPETPWQAPLDLVTIEVMRGSRYFNADYEAYNAEAMAWIRPFEATGAAPFVSRTFPEAGVKVNVYRLDAVPAIAGR